MPSNMAAVNTDKTAHAARKLFLELREAQPDEPTKNLVDQLVVRMAEKSPIGNYLYIAGNRKPPSRWTVREYLRGHLSGTFPRDLGPDLIPDLRMKQRAKASPAPRALDLGLIERLDAIDRKLNLLLSGFSAAMESLELK